MTNVDDGKASVVDRAGRAVSRAQCLPGRFIESDAPAILHFAHACAGNRSDDIERAVCLYEAIRDRIIYDPYDRISETGTFSALRALERGRGYCIPKAALLAACARALGIPARLGFADVRNHLASPRLVRANNGNVFRWHCYAELHLDARWVKATPAFDSALCRRAGLAPLEFNGRSDSVFHAYDGERQHMEYVLERGHFDDVPADQILATWHAECPAIFDLAFARASGTFSDEVAVRCPSSL
jgi:transglutaminase-like putative cysteine protease